MDSVKQIITHISLSPEVQKGHDIGPSVHCDSPQSKHVDSADTGSAYHYPALHTSNHADGFTDDRPLDKALRRREINRNAQKRIRARRQQELGEMQAKLEACQADCGALQTRIASLANQNRLLLTQIHELTTKWRQVVVENSQLNEENIQLRSSLSALDALLCLDTPLPDQVNYMVPGGS
eukprot:jgi/Chrzof1/5263/Cz15g19130.t1